jgi:hypothetical protein
MLSVEFAERILNRPWRLEFGRQVTSRVAIRNATNTTIAGLELGATRNIAKVTIAATLVGIARMTPSTGFVQSAAYIRPTSSLHQRNIWTTLLLSRKLDGKQAKPCPIVQNGRKDFDAQASTQTVAPSAAT